MQRISYPKKEQWASLSQRPIADQDHLLQIVDQIFSEVKAQGDAAVHKYTKKYDKVELNSFLVPADELKRAEKLISKELQAAIKLAKNNIEKFHRAQQEKNIIIETSKGVMCWRESRPIENIGIYIPGGTAPLFSTVLMLGVPAVIAGCKEIVLCTPPDRKGTIHPAILYAANYFGIKEIHPYGGAQAIAAMAFGTKRIKKVDKIFGPGNQYVTMAKQLVQMEGVAIDMPAGPSEVCVVADSSSKPDFVAADLLSQAEHGPDSQVVLISDSASIIEKTIHSIQAQVELLERKEIALKALENSLVILVNSMDEAIALANSYAAEHLILATDRADEYALKVEHAGSVFLGNYSPESAGDYASGTNHALPTNGYARAYSGVSLDSFLKKVTFQKISPEGLQSLGRTIITMAEAEGLDAHANAVKIRINH